MEREPIVTLVLRLPRSVKRMAEDLADKHRLTPSAYMEHLIETQYRKEMEGKER